MNHVWLSAEEQALMDTATCSAKDYGYIGLFSVEKAWKTHVQKMVGSKVDPKDYLRAFNVTGSCRFPHRWNHQHKEVRALIRLTSRQAMMMKLQHGGSNVAWVREDPTGEFWGNMLIGQWVRQEGVYRHPFYNRADDALDRFLDDGSFGPTQANVGRHYAGLEPETIPAFVWTHAPHWDYAEKPWEEVKETSWSYHSTDCWLQSVTLVDDDGETLIDVPKTPAARIWATHFWQQCQNRWFRESHGIPMKAEEGEAA